VAAAGVSVRAWRTVLVALAGALAGAAGAWLATARTHAFVPEMTGGQGFLVLALVIFGRWRFIGLTAGCLLFGAVEALQQYGQGAGVGAHIPWHLLKCLPYLTALIALAIVARGAAGPRHLGQPYDH
jgi:simple sugar transport system permease protein